MLYLTAVSILWAFSFGLIGSRLAGLDASFIAAVRLALACLCFAPFIRAKGLSRRELLQLFGIGALQFGAMYLCYLRAFAFLPSHLVALFSVLTPLYIALGYDVLRRRWRWQLLGCALLSVAGAVVIKFAEPEGSFWIGFGLMQLANIAFGLGQLLYREWRLKRPATRDHEAIGVLYAGAAAFAGLYFAIAGDFAKSVPSAEQWWVLAYLGVVASGLGFFGWNKGAVISEPGLLAAFNNAVVPLAMAASLWVFGEAAAFDAGTLAKLCVGAGCILAAIVWGKRLGEPK